MRCATSLVSLRARYTLVSVTNGNSQIEQTPLHDSFDHSLTAAEVGAAKPDPAIFEVASARTGVPLSGFCMSVTTPSGMSKPRGTSV